MPDLPANDYEYWDGVGKPEVDGKKYGLKSNSSKSRIIAVELLKHEYFKKKVLEIGCGSAILASGINTIYMGLMKYRGIDISDSFLWVAKNILNLDVQKARADAIPFEDGYFDFVWMFDVYEHIFPQERSDVAREISRVLTKDGILVMNSPMCASLHNENYDFGITKKDTDNLMEVGGFKQIKQKVISYSTTLDPFRYYLYEEFRKI